MSQRLATPPLTVVVIPGLNGLLLNELEPVAPAVISEIRTTMGVQGTSEFHVPVAADALGIGVPQKPSGSWERGTRRTSTVKSLIKTRMFRVIKAFPS